MSDIKESTPSVPLDKGDDIITEQKDAELPWETERAEVWQMAMEYYCRNLTRPAGADKWLRRERKHDRRTIWHFRVGWTGKEWNGLRQYLAKQGISKDDMLASGLIRETDGRLHDAFGPKLFVYPEVMGKRPALENATDFAKNARISDWACKDYFSDNRKRNIRLQSEYKNPANLFYNQDDLKYQTLIISEGQNDVWSVWDAIHNHDQVPENIRKAGILGTWGGPSDAQLKLLRDMCKGKTVYCAFDIGDESGAGDNYTAKMIEALADVCPVYKLDFSFAVNGAGKIDIDEFLHLDAFPHLALAKQVNDAIDGVEWLIEQLPDEEHALKINKLIEPVIETIAKIDEDLRIDFYIDKLTDMYKPLKPPAIKKMLKVKGANIADNNVQSWGKYDATAQIFVSENCYFVPGKENPRRVSNFYMKLLNRFLFRDPVTDEQFFKYECQLINYKGQKTGPVVFNPDERATPQKFVTRTMGWGDFHFSGTMQHLQDVWSFIEEMYPKVRTTNLFRQYGYIPEHKLWLFDDCAIKEGGKRYPREDDSIDVDGQGFKSENVLIYSGDKPLMNVDAAADDYIHKVIGHYWRYCDGVSTRDTPTDEIDYYPTFKGPLLLGFLVAMIYREEIIKKFRLFPILTNYGPSETGKSTATNFLFHACGFRNPPEGWEGMTIAGLRQFMSQLRCLPVWLDEFRNGSNRHERALTGMYKNAYNGVGSATGGPSGTRVVYEQGAVLWLSGEDTSPDRGLISRCTVMRFEQINDERDKSYKWLSDEKENFRGIVVRLIQDKNTPQVARFMGFVDHIMGELKARGNDSERTLINLAVPLAGFYMLDYKKDDDAFYNALIGWAVGEADEDRLRKAGEDILTKFFMDMHRLLDRDEFKECVEFCDMDNELWFCFNDFYPAYRTQLRTEADNVEMFKKSTIRDYIIRSEFFIRDNVKSRLDWVKRFDGKLKRAFRLDVMKMPEHLRELFIDDELNADIESENADNSPDF